MSAKRIIPRTRAVRDVDEIIAYYMKEATRRVALDFVDALELA